MLTRRQDALEYHAQGRPGKIEVVPTKPSLTQRDLSLAYSPGVAEPCREIARDRDLVDTYTARRNLVAVVTNGTAVLGLGDIGPYAAKPVMEGKAMLFKKFADIDVFDLEIDAKDPDAFIDTVARLEPSFGGINMEDVRAPECFYIEERLRERLSIPVFHDDQHGTAIITGAALINACLVTGRRIDEVTVVCAGAGAAAVRCMELWVALGVRREHITMLDKDGVVYRGRTHEMDPYKGAFAVETGARTLAQAMRGRDVFVGLSVGNIVDADMLRSMAPSPIIFALANPDPEVPYDLAVSTRPDAIVATGRSDYPNQVNNVLGYPYIFRGALDVRARAINEAMKLAATRALAELARTEVPDRVMQAYGLSELHFGRQYIIPKPFDDRVLFWVAPAVARAAIESGVARDAIDLADYAERLEQRLSPTRMVMRKIYSIAKSEPRRVVFPEGENEKVIKATGIVRDEKIARPVLLGNEATVRQTAERLDVDLEGVTIVSPADWPDLERYVDAYWVARRRKGLTRYNAQKAVVRERRVFGLMMVHTGDADCLVSGVTSAYPDTMRPALQIIGLAPGYRRASGMYMIVKGAQVLFCADTTVNVDPDAETLADLAVQSADAVADLGIEPRVAMLSYSNFGSSDGDEPRKVARAVELVKRRRPDLMIDGEMQADVALLPDLREEWSFSDLKGPANVLIFPGLAAGNIAYKLLYAFGGAEAIGPILLGMRKPVTVLQRNSSVDTIVNMTAITVASAIRREAKGQLTLPPDQLAASAGRGG
ncbi:MAG TPA: NADP-dependent malic enzyme [Polyangiaceae bacterium]|nr:NADP-dependent malic enzyme [Polyangiaceae bacterium]